VLIDLQLCDGFWLVAKKEKVVFDFLKKIKN